MKKYFVFLSAFLSVVFVSEAFIAAPPKELYTNSWHTNGLIPPNISALVRPNDLEPIRIPEFRRRGVKVADATALDYSSVMLDNELMYVEFLMSERATQSSWVNRLLYRFGLLDLREWRMEQTTVTILFTGIIAYAFVLRLRWTNHIRPGDFLARCGRR